MKLRLVLFFGLLFIAVFASAQEANAPATIELKNGETIEALHFGQLKCGTDPYAQIFILIRGMYMNNLVEIKEYSDIKKIELEGFKAEPLASVGNEKAKIIIFKKNGVTVTLEDAEITMGCYGMGDKYNEIIVQIMNPLTEQPTEHTIETRKIRTVTFK